MSIVGAHPRSRGENLSEYGGFTCVLGSSPLTRGKRTNSDDDQANRGLIPAHAGKTKQSSCFRCSVRAHPRSRGENVVSRILIFLSVGSSPLTRGKHLTFNHAGANFGLIPAHAGKTSLPSRWRRPVRAHPRSRGENVAVAVLITFIVGSSPLTRGKPPQPVHVEVMGRLIPAHAGKTSRARRTSWRAWAHPRSRGENVSMAPLGSQGWGSSPLTRGKRTSSTCP